ncbi:SnoaL-like domain-containing protein [Trichophyton interdigitale]|nr:SnoaL-like domain-containing protein [Trichophyton interdigitale]KAG5217074.1 SnoaL-like domain-containing protein [Trichophyton interdigitale]KAG8205587.1 SnoaL-like domain-containing protein [Trichophyton interdigitale]
MKFIPVRSPLVLAALAALTWASPYPPYQQPLRAESLALLRQLEVAAIRSEVGQGVSLFCLLVDEHRFDEMNKVFTSPNVHVDLPEDGFRNLNSLDTFVRNLYTYADYPFQHAIGVPVVEVEKSMTVAHATSPLIATIFDGYDGEKAVANEAEYGFYITDHVLTDDGWRIQNISAKALGKYLED